MTCLAYLALGAAAYLAAGAVLSFAFFCVPGDLSRQEAAVVAAVWPLVLLALVVFVGLLLWDWVSDFFR